MSYKLPDGNVLISFSGGRTSGYMLRKILDANNGIPDRAQVVFANTGRELPETLDFVNECGKQWDVHITWLEYTRRDSRVSFDIVNHNSASRKGEPLETLIRSRNYLPNIMARFCTQEAKVKTIRRYLLSLGWTHWTNTVGIRADEARRVKQSTDKRWDNWYPLNDAGATKKDVNAYWSSNTFDLGLPYGVGNCDGCFLKSEAALAEMCRKYPDRMQWWADMETAIGSTFHKSRNYAELSDFVRRQGDWIFDDEAFLCQTNEGECTG